MHLGIGIAALVTLLLSLLGGAGQLHFLLAGAGCLVALAVAALLPIWPRKIGKAARRGPPPLSERLLRLAFSGYRRWVGVSIVTALLLFVLPFFGHGSTLKAGAFGALALCCAAVLNVRRQDSERLNGPESRGGPPDVVRIVVEEASVALEQLENAARNIADRRVRALLDDLAGTARTVMEGLGNRRERLSAVQRLLTYYLPSAATLAESYAIIEQQRTPDQERLGQLRDMLGKLEGAFSHYEDALQDARLPNLDVELRLMEAALKEDIRGQPRA
jgi:hypothetical protein